MGKVKNHFWDEIEANAMRIDYPEEYTSIHEDCERAVYDLGQQLEHIMTFAPVVVREQKPEMIKHLIKLAHYIGDLR